MTNTIVKNWKDTLVEHLVEGNDKEDLALQLLERMSVNELLVIFAEVLELKKIA